MFCAANSCEQYSIRLPWDGLAVAPLYPRLAALIGEETTPYYRPDRFHATQLGQVLQEKYQVVAKLGYGSSSTVWLARDLDRWRWMKDKSVAHKIAAVKYPSSESEGGMKDELSILDRISQANPQQAGWHFVRRLIDTFSIAGVGGDHTCIAFEPLHLKTDNIMIRFEDPEMPHEIARDEYSNPLPPKRLHDGRIIYLPRNDYGPLKRPTEVIQITDFDRSTRGTASHSGCIQADVYRAPQRILNAGYSYSADIWNLGVMVSTPAYTLVKAFTDFALMKLWDLLEGKWLFDVDKSTHEYDEELHLAQITALLGPRPESFSIGQRTALFYRTNGQLKNPDRIPNDLNFEDSVTCMHGKDKKLFIDFVKRMIKWCPE